MKTVPEIGTREAPVKANQVRRERGHAAIALHPDRLDKLTAAQDIVADILHAVFDMDPPEGTPEAFLQSALYTFEGDEEDDRRDPWSEHAGATRSGFSSRVVTVEVESTEPSALPTSPEGLTVELLGEVPPHAFELVRLTGELRLVRAFLIEQWDGDGEWADSVIAAVAEGAAA